MLDLKTGLVGTSDLIVGEEHTATSVGSGVIGVLATPVMINVMEAAALEACEAYLPQGCQSLGTYLEISHVAATPVGMTVSATAELTKIDGRLLEFRVRATDDVEEIGAGTHRRIVVNVDKFASRVDLKKTDGR